MPNIFMPRDLRPNTVVGLAVIRTSRFNTVARSLGDIVAAPCALGPGSCVEDISASPARMPLQVVGVVASARGWVWHRDIADSGSPPRDMIMDSAAVVRLGRVTHAGKSTAGTAILKALRTQEDWARLPRITIHLGM
jgi:hypothetical protein